MKKILVLIMCLLMAGCAGSPKKEKNLELLWQDLELPQDHYYSDNSTIMSFDRSGNTYFTFRYRS